MRTTIGGYDYYTTKQEASKNKRYNEITAYEGGLGWYNYNPEEYKSNPRKRIFGF